MLYWKTTVCVYYVCVHVGSLSFISYLIVPKAHQKHFIASSLHSLSCLFFSIQQPPILLSYINKSANDLENSLSTQIVCWGGCGTPEHLFQFTPQHCQRTLERLWRRKAYGGVVGGLEFMLFFSWVLAREEWW